MQHRPAAHSKFGLAAAGLLALSGCSPDKPAEPSMSSQEVCRLQQYHIDPSYTANTMDPSKRESIERSQFRIAQILLSGPCAVIDESTYEIPGGLPQESLKPDIQRSIKEKIFPQGLPNRFELLSAEQRKTLAEVGSARVASCLGNVEILPSETMEMQVRIVTGYALFSKKYGSFSAAMTNSAELRFLITDYREGEWSHRLDRWISSHQGTSQKLFLVAGAAHDSAPFDSKLFHYVNCEKVTLDPEDAASTKELYANLVKDRVESYEVRNLKAQKALDALFAAEPKSVIDDYRTRIETWVRKNAW